MPLIKLLLFLLLFTIKSPLAWSTLTPARHINSCKKVIPSQQKKSTKPFKTYNTLNGKVQNEISTILKEQALRIEAGIQNISKSTKSTSKHKNYVLQLLLKETKLAYSFFKTPLPSQKNLSSKNRKDFFKYFKVFSSIATLDIEIIIQRDLRKDLKPTERTPGKFLEISLHDSEAQVQFKILNNLFNTPLKELKKSNIEEILGYRSSLYKILLPAVFSYTTSYETTNLLFSQGFIPLFLTFSYDPNTHGGLDPTPNRAHDLIHLEFSAIFRLIEFLNQYSPSKKDTDSIIKLKKLANSVSFAENTSYIYKEINKLLTGKILKDFNSYEQKARINQVKLLKKINSDPQLNFVLFTLWHELFFTGLTSNSLQQLKKHRHRYLKTLLTKRRTLEEHPFEGKVMDTAHYLKVFDKLFLLMKDTLKEN